MNYLNTTHLIILSLLFIRLQIVRKILLLFISGWSSYLVLFIRLQMVRKLLQFFEDPSSDHPIPSSVFSSYEKFLQLFEDPLSDHPIRSSSSIFSRLFVHLIICFTKSSNHPLHPSSACSWFWSIVQISLIWSSYPVLICLQLVRKLLFFEVSSNYPIPSSSSAFRWFVVLVNCSTTTHLIIPSFVFIRLQIVR